MNEKELLSLLGSADFAKINRALVYIGSQLANHPSEKLTQRLIELSRDADPDIRNEAIYAAGHWHLTEILPRLIEVASQNDEDDLVLNSVIYAIDKIATGNPALRLSGLKALARVALNDSMPKKIRETAYALASLATSRISINEFGKVRIPSSNIVIDKDWLSSLSLSGDPSEL